MLRNNGLVSHLWNNGPRLNNDFGPHELHKDIAKRQTNAWDHISSRMAWDNNDLESLKCKNNLRHKNDLRNVKNVFGTSVYSKEYHRLITRSYTLGPLTTDMSNKPLNKVISQRTQTPQPRIEFTQIVQVYHQTELSNLYVTTTNKTSPISIANTWAHTNAERSGHVSQYYTMPSPNEISVTSRQGSAPK